jgi:hypothetical protein
MEFDAHTRLKSVAWRPKFQAFAVHFSISLLIFLTLLYFIFYQWYPTPFFTTDGGTQGLRLIIFVDLILGPTLTFIVFKHNKPGLKLDLTLIAITQVAALSYGIFTVHNERPVAVVFADDRFTPIPWYEFHEAGHKLSDLNKFGDHLPVPIYVKLPDDMDARMALYKQSFKTSTGLFMLGDRYQRIDQTSLKDIVKHSINMDSYLKQDYLKDKKAEMQRTYREFLKSFHHSLQDYLFLPVFARYCKCILVAERTTLKFVDVLKIPPPQITQTVIKIHRKQPTK